MEMVKLVLIIAGIIGVPAGMWMLHLRMRKLPMQRPQAKESSFMNADVCEVTFPRVMVQGLGQGYRVVITANPKAPVQDVTAAIREGILTQLPTGTVALVEIITSSEEAYELLIDLVAKLLPSQKLLAFLSRANGWYLVRYSTEKTHPKGAIIEANQLAPVVSPPV